MFYAMRPGNGGAGGSWGQCNNIGRYGMGRREANVVRVQGSGFRVQFGNGDDPTWTVRLFAAKPDGEWLHPPCSLNPEPRTLNPVGPLEARTVLARRRAWGAR